MGIANIQNWPQAAVAISYAVVIAIAFICSVHALTK